MYDSIPSTAARVAVNIRFFRRNGLDRTTAIGVARLDSVGGFVGQISLMLATVGFGRGSLNIGKIAQCGRCPAASSGVD